MRRILRSWLIAIATRIAKRFGSELRSEPSLVAFLTAYKVDLVIDVGANQGQFATKLRKAGYSGQIISFEPVADPFIKLAAAAQHDPLWTATRSAIGEAEGTATIHVSKATPYSSIKVASAFGLDRDSRMIPTHTEQVPISTLDAVLEGLSATAVFLKIDTQGFEQEILRGASETLKSCVGVQLELPIGHLYEGVWDFDEAIVFMKSAGFLPAQFRTVCLSRKYPAAALEVDCVFRKDYSLCLSPNPLPVTSLERS